MGISLPWSPFISTYVDPISMFRIRSIDSGSTFLFPRARRIREWGTESKAFARSSIAKQISLDLALASFRRAYKVDVFSNMPYILSSTLAASRRVMILLSSRYIVDAIVIGRHLEMSVVPSVFGRKIVRLAFTELGKSADFKQMAQLPLGGRLLVQPRPPRPVLDG
ncbi:hypothetical protein T01_14575 [Trichinella spiralis]|uniref:Uncharacterized protein n=1 Tax=Trichinella spiralis TaxID=6334 RepID=A0A0V1BX60_TRISP|nr:hypothetical protein T01_14575 [Trichinella spiralis]